MNTYLFAAGILCIALGLIHSILGEIRIFHRQRKQGNIAPTIPKEDWKAAKIGILWATWHMASLFGWCIGALLLKIAYLNEADFTQINWMVPYVIYTMIGAALMVIVGTKARHPGWIVLLAIAVLLYIGS